MGWGKVVEIVGDSKAASYVFANGGSQTADEDSGELLILEALLDILGVSERAVLRSSFAGCGGR